MKNFILSYGTLRKNDTGANQSNNSNRRKIYNFDRFGAGTQKYLKTLRLPGFSLYSLGPYPTISEGPDEITVELHEITDSRAMSGIRGMEGGAGYLEKNIEVENDGETISATIFYYPKERLSARVLAAQIKSGDWCE